MIVAVSLHNLAPDTVDFCDQKTQLDIFLDKKTFLIFCFLLDVNPIRQMWRMWGLIIRNC